MINGDYIMVVAPEGYPGFRYRGRYCYEHRLVYWLTHGVMPGPGEVIHHKNENKHDNRPENLELMQSSDHSHQHRYKGGRKTRECVCPECGETFKTVNTWSKRAVFCGRSCSGKHSGNKYWKSIRGSKMGMRSFVTRETVGSTPTPGAG